MNVKRFYERKKLVRGAFSVSVEPYLVQPAELKYSQSFVRNQSEQASKQTNNPL